MDAPACGRIEPYADAEFQLSINRVGLIVAIGILGSLSKGLRYDINIWLAPDSNLIFSRQHSISSFGTSNRRRFGISPTDTEYAGMGRRILRALLLAPHSRLMDGQHDMKV